MIYNGKGLTVNLITCVDKDVLTKFFGALVDWSLWTNGFTEWPTAYSGQHAGSPHKESGCSIFKLPRQLHPDFC